MNNLKVIITGCGVKPVTHIYKHNNKPTHDSIVIEGNEHKMNIGTATAYYLSQKGISVIMVSRSIETLSKIKAALISLGCNSDLISCIASDITR